MPRLLMAAGVILAFHVLGQAYAGFALGLGSISEPTYRHSLFLLYYTLVGGLSALLLTLALVRLGPGPLRGEGWDDRRFLGWAVVLGFCVPAALRLVVLGGAPITDDEALYRFGAELLLSGRLTAPSHPLKLFFDHAFLVNDGEMYSQYFLGWPAILSVGVLLGAPGFVNAVLSALTVPPLYMLVRGLTGRFWAQLTVIVFLTSPMLQLMAATGLSHTSGLAALTWTAWAVHRLGEEAGGRWWLHALVGLLFSVAFFIRPLTALGIGGPFLALWAVRWWKDGRSGRDLAAFLLPTVTLAALFLLVNQIQTGSALKPAYVATREYAAANGFRFSGLNPADAPEVPNLAFAGLAAAARIVVLGLTRLNYALFGWPSAFVFLPLAWRVGRSGVFWWALGVFLLLHLPLRDPGIDTVGPVHLTELALPILVLTAMGLRRGALWLEERAFPGRRIAVASAVAMMICGLTLYTPYRLKAVWVVSTLTHVPRMALEANGVEDAVVFVSPPYAAGCNPAIPVPSRSFVLWWPVNDPDFENDVLYANHLSVEADRALMEHFPGRSGWIHHWLPDCTLELTPLAEATAEQIPNAMMVRSREEELAWYFDERHPLTGERPEGFDPEAEVAR